MSSLPASHMAGGRGDIEDKRDSHDGQNGHRVRCRTIAELEAMLLAGV